MPYTALAARNNPRGVPALELRAIGQRDFTLPRLDFQDRLPRLQECVSSGRVSPLPDRSCRF
jgi:hypothetical protein